MKSKKILGLDLGTNSIGWALVERSEASSKIIKLGTRIIPMDAATLGDFEKGNKVSQTAERTKFRSVRRLRERFLLRRERLHRVLNILGFLPRHYSKEIDFDKNFGQFINESEPKIAYYSTPNPDSLKERKTDYNFLFMDSFKEMIAEFKKTQPQLFYIKTNGKETKIPYDWTIYYLRKKALTQKIEKEELAWILLNFNQKRGYYQLRGEEVEEKVNKKVEYYSLKIIKTTLDETSSKNDEKWYHFELENGWVYKRTSKAPLDWTGKIRDFIVTTDLNDDQTEKLNADGTVKRSFRSPKEDDWGLLKIKTENEISLSGQTVGEYIYERLLVNPLQKIRGEYVRTIERNFYKAELRKILEKQVEFHSELKDPKLYKACCEELYEVNEGHRKSLSGKDFSNLFLNDLIFYQRPLKSKKSLISNCKFEKRVFLKNGEKCYEHLKCASKSHPLFQEFRIWQFLENLKIIRLSDDVDVTEQFLKSEEDWVKLFDWMNCRKDIDQKAFLKYSEFQLKKEASLYRWSYIENDKSYPCNETRSAMLSRLEKAGIDQVFLSKEKEIELWHLLYSVNDKEELSSGLKRYSEKNRLSQDFVKEFIKFPPFKSDYCAFSEKALKKLLPLMRRGSYWSESSIHAETKVRIEKIIDGEYDEKIKDRVRTKAKQLDTIEKFYGLPVWLASYVVYDRHSEDSDLIHWRIPQDIDDYLKNGFKQHFLRNPIVEQVIAETLRVVRDVWNFYGNGKEKFFDEIHVELGREMKNPADKRKSITESNIKNETTNLRIRAILMELFNDKNIENVRPYSPSQQEIMKIYEDGVLQSYSEIPEDILKISKTSEPSTAEINKYKIWLDQKYISPYTKSVIPLSKLFTSAYEIEHIIPQSRFFDDSFSNKVICESAVNKDKDNRLAFEYIKQEGGKKIDIGNGKFVTIIKENEYIEFVNKTYVANRIKKRNLLLEDIPDSFVQRQLNDTRFISKVVKNLLSNILREEDELESVSKNLISTSGMITSVLRQDWGMNEVWNELMSPRFERLNALSNSNDFGTINPKTKKFLPTVPLALRKGFNIKRLDHRHHALDALVVACVTRDHINYLNNESALGKESNDVKLKKRYDLRAKLCTKKFNEGSETHYRWVFNLPWKNIVVETKEMLENTIVSFKQNLRIISKTVNYYDKLEKDAEGKLKKVRKKQVKGENWAVRKPLHKDTVSGIISLQRKKLVNISVALENHLSIVDPSLRKQISKLFELKYDLSKVKKFFKDNNNQWDGKDVSRVEIYYFNSNLAASRTTLNDTFTETYIKECVADSAIQKILLNHLKLYENRKDEKGKLIAPESLAFCQEGIEDMNKNIKLLNDGKDHKPIFKVRTYETLGNKFSIGNTANKSKKFVEAQKGTNLFFGIYQDTNGKRIFETIPLNIVVDRTRKNLKPVPEKNIEGDELIMSLSPNDLVSLVGENIDKNLDAPGRKFIDYYKLVSFSGKQCFFIQANIASSIIDKAEFSALNKMEKSIHGIMIKEKCIKLNVDRLGNISPIHSQHDIPNNNPEKFEIESNHAKEPDSAYGQSGKISFFKDHEDRAGSEAKYNASLSMEECLSMTLGLMKQVFGERLIGKNFPGKLMIKKL
ncbi:MAG TPA: HNH endonuclease domain-containing protein [Saprospiraceae bacterium]|nr:HNH endonuclease domain-containing protein [Saprospiraceae bacterium]